jgi:uncharacterized membrane protein
MTNSTSRSEGRALDAKEPLTPLAGPYGHPFHPMLVTVPIGAWVCSLVFDIVTRAKSAGSVPLNEAAYWLIGIGIIGAVIAALFGLMDLLTIPRHTRAFATGLTHMVLNLAVVALYVVNFVWRHSTYYDEAKVRGGQLVLSVVAIVLLAVSGWLGGTLAYHFGVRVADERRQAADGYERSVRS